MVDPLASFGRRIECWTATCLSRAIAGRCAWFAQTLDDWQRGRRSGPRSTRIGRNLAVTRALELLPPKTKHDFGQLLIELLPKKKLVALRPALLWALGRVGARVPVYGPLNVVPQSEVVSRWIETLLEQLQPEPLDHWVIMQLARKTGDRYRDLSPSLQIKIINKLTDQQVEPHLLTLIREGGTLLDEEQSRVFGESLPKGLRIS